MVLIFSAHSNNSEQVLREVQLAVKARLHIIQFRIEDVHLNDDLEYFLSTPHWLDALTPPLENHLRRLEGSIKKLLEVATEERATRETISGAPVHQALQRRSKKVWLSIGGGVLAGLIVAAFLLKSPRPLQNRALAPAPIASKESAKPSATTAETNEVVLKFREVDLSKVSGHAVPAGQYLKRAGISVADIQPAGSEIVLISNRELYVRQQMTVRPTVIQNWLTQINTGNAPTSFTVKFEQPVRSVSFTRPALPAQTDSGVSHPAWSVHALDAEGHELIFAAEPLTRSFSDIPANELVLRMPDLEPIAAVRFESDPQLNGQPFAAFSALLIERLTLVREPKSSR